jgi:hypothetical protein
MRIREIAVVLVCVALVPALVQAQHKKKDKKSVPAVLGTARYVYVQAEEGDLYQPGLLNEDRQAIADVEDAIQDWKRYAITANAKEAELVFIVRKGRLASGRLGGTVGTASPYPGQPRTTPTVGGSAEAETGPPDDLLEVKMRNPDGSLSGPIWMRSQPEGLNAPRVPLLRMLRDAVEKDYPQ